MNMERHKELKTVVHEELKLMNKQMQEALETLANGEVKLMNTERHKVLETLAKNYIIICEYDEIEKMPISKEEKDILKSKLPKYECLASSGIYTETMKFAVGAAAYVSKK